MRVKTNYKGVRCRATVYGYSVQFCGAGYRPCTVTGAVTECRDTVYSYGV